MSYKRSQTRYKVRKEKIKQELKDFSSVTETNGILIGKSLCEIYEVLKI
jgi:hypothetical protein